jgi:DNA-binding NarL/FixJ family response regulator
MDNLWLIIMVDKNPLIKVMIVSRSQTESSMLQDLLSENENFELVCQSYSGRDALLRCTEYAPDVILITPDFDDENEIDLIRTMLSDCPLCQCIMISPPGSIDWSREVMLAGCRYLLNKPIQPERLYDAILKTYQALEEYRKQQNEA